MVLDLLSRIEEVKREKFAKIHIYISLVLFIVHFFGTRNKTLHYIVMCEVFLTNKTHSIGFFSFSVPMESSCHKTHVESSI